MTGLLLTIVIAFLGQARWHLWTMQPRHAGVMYIPSIGHASHAASMTSTLLGLLLSPPSAILMRSWTIARSLYMQQRIVGLGPGEMSLGMSM